MLNKKFLTKIANNDEFRKNFLLKNQKTISKQELQLKEYARYVVDYQILNRDNKYASDPKSAYGFSPIGPICYVDTSNEVITKIFEMNSINHFLKDKNGLSAVEVAECILAQLYAECKDNISSFNVKMIDDALTSIEKSYIPTTEEETETNNEH